MPTMSLTEWYIMFFTCSRGQRSFVITTEWVFKRTHLKLVLVVYMAV